MTEQRHDRQIVEAFAQHLRDNGMADLKVDSWLEDLYPGTSQVEAIVGPFAVEHTSCDSFHNQRASAIGFDEIVTPIERLLSPAMPGRIRVHLPSGSTSKGKDWSALRTALAVWLVREVATMPEGSSAATVPGTDVTVQVSKDSKGSPLLVFWLEAADLPPLTQRVRDLVLRKAVKLAPHASAAKTRVLLLESYDGVNMSAEKMLEALGSAFDGMPEGIDQLWFVDNGFNLGPQFIDFTPRLSRRG